MDTLELIERSKQGDKAARDMVVSMNIGLVWLSLIHISEPTRPY